MHLAPQAGLNPTNPALSPNPVSLPHLSSPCRVSVWMVIILVDFTSSQLTSSPLVLLSFLSLSCHFLSMMHGKMVQDGRCVSCQVGQVHPSGLPGGISGHLQVFFMDPAGMLPELQALVLLVDETVFFPMGLSVLALRRQKEGMGGKWVNQRAGFSGRFQDKLTCCWCHNTEDLQL